MIPMQRLARIFQFVYEEGKTFESLVLLTGYLNIKGNNINVRVEFYNILVPNNVC